MTQLQLIEGLAAACEALLAVVKHLAGKLAQLEALDAADQAALDAARQQYVGVIGADEVPDDVGGDRCVCCGEVVPEDRMVCPACEAGRWPGKG